MLFAGRPRRGRADDAGGGAAGGVARCASAGTASLSLEVKRVNAVLLLQTASVYHSATALVQLYETISSQKPLILVRETNGRYDVNVARETLKNPAAVLPAAELTLLQNLPVLESHL